MKHLALAIFAATATMSAQDSGQAFAAKTFQDGDFVLNYRIHVPDNIPPGERVPLVLLLHGAGERGDDNASQLRHGVQALLAYAGENHIPAIILVPQCPLDAQWVDVPWGEDSHTMPATPSRPMRAVRALLAQTLATLPIDPARVYLTGVSMGGFGTWDLLQRDPELFAAAIPICGGGDLAEAKRLANIPIRAFHGDNDQTVKPSRSRDMVEAIKRAGGRLADCTEYPGVGHDAWSVTYANDEVLEWLFRQKKSRAKADEQRPNEKFHNERT